METATEESKTAGVRQRSLLDVRVKRGADVGSDHQMVVATVKVKLRKTGCKKTIRCEETTETQNKKCFCSAAEEQIPSPCKNGGPHKA